MSRIEGGAYTHILHGNNNLDVFKEVIQSILLLLQLTQQLFDNLSYTLLPIW